MTKKTDSAILKTALAAADTVFALCTAAIDTNDIIRRKRKDKR
jgi:hypothetical protein